MMWPRSGFMLLLILFFSTLLMSSVYAQDQASKAYQMDEVRVVASPIIQGNQLDRQERLSRLKEMAFHAGFSEMEILWRDPTEFYALVAFRGMKPPRTERSALQ